MKLSTSVSISEIAKIIEAELIGNPDVLVTGINEIHKVEKGDITFCDIEKYMSKALQSDASVVIVNADAVAPPGKSLLKCDKPFDAFNSLIRKFRKFEHIVDDVSQSAVVHPSAIIDPNVVISHHVVIGANSHIASNSIILHDTVIGENVKIQPGTIIGSDAFYYKSEGNKRVKLESCGRVVIGNDVEIGAGCTIDRGVTGETIIGNGTKIDNQVHVAHGCVIGENCILAAQVGIGGKCIIGNNVKLWGQVGVAPRLTIEDDVEVYAQSGVSSDLKAGKKYFGSPAVEAEEWFKNYRALKRVPREIEELRKNFGLG